MGNSWDSIATTEIMALGLSNAFQQRWEPRLAVGAREMSETGRTVRHQASRPEILPRHQNVIWPEALPPETPCLAAPLDFHCPAGHTSSLSLTSCPRCLPLCEKMGAGRQWPVSWSWGVPQPKLSP